jgi:2-dehydropantoate 2-reductase
MRIAIVGAGAIGGYLATRLILSGQPVTVIARGANLAAIRSSGITLRLPDGTEERARPSWLRTTRPPRGRTTRSSWR